MGLLGHCDRDILFEIDRSLVLRGLLIFKRGYREASSVLLSRVSISILGKVESDNHLFLIDKQKLHRES